MIVYVLQENASEAGVTSVYATVEDAKARAEMLAMDSTEPKPYTWRGEDGTWWLYSAKDFPLWFVEAFEVEHDA